MVDQEGGSDAPDGRVVEDQVARRSGSVVDGDDGLKRAREVYAAVGGESAFYAGGGRAIRQADDDPIAIGDAAAMRRFSGQQGDQCAIVQRLMASWPCRVTAECPASSEALQTAVEAQMAADALAVRTVIEQLAESMASASASALTLAYYLQMSYGPSAVSKGRDLPVKTADDGRLELLRVLEIVLSASAAAVAEAKIAGYVAAVGKLSHSDTTEARMRIDRAVRLRQTAELAKRTATGRVVSAATCIQAAARVQSAQRMLAYARLAALAVPVIRRHEAVVRLQKAARGLAARRQAESLRAWARRVVDARNIPGWQEPTRRRKGCTRLRGGGREGKVPTSPPSKSAATGHQSVGSHLPRSPQSVMDGLQGGTAGSAAGKPEESVVDGADVGGLHEAGDARPRRHRKLRYTCRSERLAMQGGPDEQEEGGMEEDGCRYWEDEAGFFGSLSQDEIKKQSAECVEDVEREVGILEEEREQLLGDELLCMRRRLGLLGYGVGAHTRSEVADTTVRAAAAGRRAAADARWAKEGVDAAAPEVARARKGVMPQSTNSYAWQAWMTWAGAKGSREEAEAASERYAEARISAMQGPCVGQGEQSQEAATEARGDQSVRLMSVLVPAALSGDREFVALVPGGRQFLVRAPEGAKPGSQLTIAVSSQDVPKPAVPQEPTEAAVDTAASAAVSTDAEARAFVAKLLALHDLALARGVGLMGASGAPAGGGRKRGGRQRRRERMWRLRSGGVDSDGGTEPGADVS